MWLRLVGSKIHFVLMCSLSKFRISLSLQNKAIKIVTVIFIHQLCSIKSKSMWTKENIAGQHGKTILITGANTGIGFETALALYQAGAHVILACRSKDKALDTVIKLEAEGGDGSLEIGVIDLADLESVKQFADDFKARYTTLDVLINNAGVMVPPASYTKQGFELQYGVNFLGHFALTGYLYCLLRGTPNSRVVMLSSLAAKGVTDFDNLKMEKSYDAAREYGISKMACLQFVVEMQKRVTAAADGVLITAAHPGGTYTDLSRYLTQDAFTGMIETYGELMAPWQGALPILYAAVSQDVAGGGYYGPDGGIRGYPAVAEFPEEALDANLTKLLWEKAEALTGVYYL
jgi:NAD(P)-dependent dehydrogenase (short-subunit alcohol dehydrogenase family)